MTVANPKRPVLARIVASLVLPFALLSSVALGENALSIRAMDVAADRARMHADEAKHPELTPLHVLAQILSKAEDEDMNVANYFMRATMDISDQVIATLLDQVSKELHKLDKTRHPGAQLDKAKWEEVTAHMNTMASLLGRQPGIQEFLATCLELRHLPHMAALAKHLDDIGVTREKLEKGSDLDKIDPLKGMQILYENRRGIYERTWGQHHPDRFTGRLSEVELIIDALAYEDKITVLDGKAGSGKTSLVEEVAKRIVEGDASLPGELLDRRPPIVRIDMLEIMGQAGGDGKAVLDRFDRAMTQASKDPSAIIFVDNLGSVKKSKLQGGGGVVPIIFTKLASVSRPNKIIVAGAGVGGEIGDDVKSAFRVQELKKPEETTELMNILDKHRIAMEDEMGIKIPQTILADVVRLTDRYITTETQPASSIQLLRDAAAMLRKEKRERERPGAVPISIQKHQERLARFRVERQKYEGKDRADMKARDRKNLDKIEKGIAEMEETIAELKGDWERGKTLLKEIAAMEADAQHDKDTLEIRKAELREIQTRSRFHYDEMHPYHLAFKLYERTGIPLNGILGTMQDRIGGVVEFFQGRLIDQPEAVAQTIRIQRRIAAGFQDSDRPSVSIYVGSTGTGKTYLAKLEAEFQFGDPEAMFRLDMAEFSQDVDVNKVKGTAPGYIGFDNPIPFVEHIKKHPYSLILLDEVEKAHESFFDLLHGILEDGHFRDAQGNEVDCRNLRFVMTSNLGATYLQHAWDNLDEPDPVKKYQIIQQLAIKIMQEGDPTKNNEFKFPAAIVGRIKLSDIIVFRNLTPAGLAKIFDLELKKWEDNREALRDADFIPTDRAKAKLTEIVVERGAEFGARGIRDIISATLEDPLSELKTDRETAPAVEKHGRMRIDYDEAAGGFTVDVPKSSEQTCPESFARLGKVFPVPPKPTSREAASESPPAPTTAI